MEHLIWSYNKLVSVVSFPNKIVVKKKEWVSEWLLFSNFEWDDDEVSFVLDQQT